MCKVDGSACCHLQVESWMLWAIAIGLWSASDQSNTCALRLNECMHNVVKQVISKSINKNIHACVRTIKVTPTHPASSPLPQELQQRCLSAPPPDSLQEEFSAAQCGYLQVAVDDDNALYRLGHHLRGYCPVTRIYIRICMLLKVGSSCFISNSSPHLVSNIT